MENLLRPVGGGGVNSFKIFIMNIQLLHTYNDIICLENLLLAWQEFIIGKKKRKDVQIFSRNLMDNIVALHEDLVNHTYQHGGYESFFVTDPKCRHIHKASVRDRLLHHAIYRILYPFFDKTFIGNSYSYRKNKGTHKAINQFRKLLYKVSQNNTQACWILKCDIRKFFASIDHDILLNILKQYISDKDIIWLLSMVVESFVSELPHPDPLPLSTGRQVIKERGDIGLPLGNLTSQLFANIYMNELDQFVKHRLKVRHYVRYADDFVFVFHNRKYLEIILEYVQEFLNGKLKLILHPNKIFLQTTTSGIDFLGWKHFSDHRVLRKTTKKRMLNRIKNNSTNETLQSYLGMLKHGDGLKLREELLNEFWLWS